MLHHAATRSISLAAAAAASLLSAAAVAAACSVLLLFSGDEGTARPAREAVRPRHHPRLQEVEVEPVREHVAAADRGGEHQGGGWVVRREAHRLRLQGQDEEQRLHHPLHLGQGHPPARQLRCRPRQVPVQPPAHLHGQEGPRLHVSCLCCETDSCHRGGFYIS
uniref:Uncharacterized protein n=1 Tax=Oryza rufipogon TaxID=4529 RepID=A0A0E0PR16_ORYRU